MKTGDRVRSKHDDRVGTVVETAAIMSDDDTAMIGLAVLVEWDGNAVLSRVMGSELIPLPEV